MVTATSTATGTATGIVTAGTAIGVGTGIEATEAVEEAAAAAEKALFASLEHDASAVQEDLNKEAAIVQDISASRAERVPWLEKTGFPAYLAGL
jgi:hypothetical protein